jgi:2-polyprenyl-3-methyl-5-hydroxy-6-metoxy-1,4-benzoquinol methylase
MLCEALESNTNRNDSQNGAPHNGSTSFKHVLDNVAIKTIGRPWLELTRDSHIHERCAYLTDCVRRLHTQNLRMLDVGCGSATVLFYLENYAKNAVSRYVGLDMLPQTRLRNRYKDISIRTEFHQLYLDQDWNFGEFDLVWCSEVIEHIMDDRKLLKKLASQLRADGTLIITTPSKLFVEMMGRDVPGYDSVSTAQDGGHVRTGYDLPTLRTLGDDCGLTLLSHAWVHPSTAQDVRWHMVPNPSPVAAVARNLRDILARRHADFVRGGDPALYAHRYVSISAIYGKKK